MNFDPKNIHVVLVGYKKTVNQYFVNLDLYRQNFSFGKDLWITTVYNDDLNACPSGIGENTWINAQDGGYATGALYAINEGLEFAYHFNRDIILVHNFDVLFFTEDGFKRCIQEFVDSDKLFSAAVDINQLPATDCMIFKKEALDRLIPIPQYYQGYREHLEIAKRYKDTQLGFDNMEEFMFSSLVNYCSDKFDRNPDANPEEIDHYIKSYMKETIWFPMSRFDLPRLYWSEELALGHCHDLATIKEKLTKYQIKEGNFVKQLVGN